MEMDQVHRAICHDILLSHVERVATDQAVYPNVPKFKLNVESIDSTKDNVYKDGKKDVL